MIQLLLLRKAINSKNIEQIKSTPTGGNSLLQYLFLLTNQGNDKYTKHRRMK